MVVLSDFDIDSQILFRYSACPDVTTQSLAIEFGISRQAIDKKIKKIAAQYALFRAKKPLGDADSEAVITNRKLIKLEALIRHLQRQLIINSTNAFSQSCYLEKLQRAAPSVTKSRLDQYQKLQVLRNFERFQRRGGTLKEFSGALGRRSETIQRWLKDYRNHGLNGLLNKTTRPKHFRNIANQNKEDAKTRARKLIEILHNRPKAYEINRSNWTLRSVAEAYERTFKVSISHETVSRLLKKNGYTIKKARKVLTSPDPEYRVKVELLLHTLQNLRVDDFLFFIDEMGPIRIKKYGGRLFVHKNTKPSIPQVQTDKGSITMSAALNATKNQVTWLYSRAKDTTAMIDLIEILFNQHPTAKTIYLTWDAAAWHRSMGLVQWLDDFNSETHRLGSGPTIHLVPLPTSSQFLDVLEAVFSGMKKAVIHHSDYQCKSEMKTAISQHFADRNIHFEKNPKRAGKKIWELDFFKDIENLKSGDYREW